MRELLAWARRRGRHLTFRAAGTSLSGQAVSDDVLVEIGPFFRGARVLDDGARVWTQPGVVGAHLNRLLAAHRTRIGPDPASIDAAMVGGILANNSSGMCCGVAQNSYHTLDSLRGPPRRRHRGRHRRSPTPTRRSAGRGRPSTPSSSPCATRSGATSPSPPASATSSATKNTSGYSLNAFVDYDRPADILAHLMVGSEGTLGFVAEMTFRTVPEPPARATALVFFAELEEAGAAVAPLAAAGADALEILDAASLRSIATEHPLPFEIEKRHAALLVELRRMDEAPLAAVDRRRAGDPRALPPPRAAALHDRRGGAGGALAPAQGPRRAHRARCGRPGPPSSPRTWRCRSRGSPRRSSTSRPSSSATAIPDTVIFGHAKDGNLHFVLAEDVRSPEAVERYGAFMQGLVDLVVDKYDGAIKAEHGVGPQHGALREDGVGRARVRGDGARQADARPRRHPEPRRRR